MLRSVSFIPPGPRSAEHLLVSYRHRVRCRTPVFEILTCKGILTAANTSEHTARSLMEVKIIA